MRKLEEFKKSSDNLLSDNELLSINGGLLLTSRTLCTSETCQGGCSDIKAVRTTDNDDGTTTIEENTWVSGDDCP